MYASRSKTALGLKGGTWGCFNQHLHAVSFRVSLRENSKPIKIWDDFQSDWRIEITHLLNERIRGVTESRDTDANGTLCGKKYRQKVKRSLWSRTTSRFRRIARVRFCMHRSVSIEPSGVSELQILTEQSSYFTKEHLQGNRVFIIGRTVDCGSWPAPFVYQNAHDAFVIGYFCHIYVWNIVLLSIFRGTIRIGWQSSLWVGVLVAFSF